MKANKYFKWGYPCGTSRANLLFSLESMGSPVDADGMPPVEAMIGEGCRKDAKYGGMYESMHGHGGCCSTHKWTGSRSTPSKLMPANMNVREQHDIQIGNGCLVLSNQCIG